MIGRAQLVNPDDGDANDDELMIMIMIIMILMILMIIDRCPSLMIGRAQLVNPGDRSTPTFFRLSLYFRCFFYEYLT